jgi:hypothetical protein
LKVSYGGETIDLGTCRTKCAEVKWDGEGTHIELTPARLKFGSGLSASLITRYHFCGRGKIVIERQLADVSDQATVLELTEYFKGCYGITEYPEDMHGIRLSVNGDRRDSIEYAYKNRRVETGNAGTVSAVIPQISTEVALEALDRPAVSGSATEGYLFNPYYTLELKSEIKSGERMRTCLWIRKNQ